MTFSNIRMSRRLVLGGALGVAAGAGPLPGMAQGAKALVVGVQGLPDSLDPGLNSFAALNLAYQTMDPLVLRDDTGALLPGLASKWTAVSPSSWRFDLRTDAKFHDGTPFTAKDVKFTLDDILAPKSTNGLKSRISQITGTEIAGDHAVIINTKGPFPTLINALSDIAILPRHFVEKVGRDGFIRQPMGTGPFEFVRWVPGDRYELKAFKGHWGGAPWAETFTIRQIPEGSTRIAALISGEAHIIEEIPVDLMPAVEKSANAAVTSVESTVGLILTFDARKPPFNDKRVRQAINYAIDKEKLLARMLNGQGKVLQGQILTSNTLGFNPSLKPYAFDPAKAKALLAEAGLAGGFETSLTTRSGKYLSDVDLCTAAAAMLADVGIKVKVNVVEQGVFSKMTTAKDLGPMHMVGWYSLGDADFATVWFTEASGRAFWKNEEYEKLFVEARSTVDQAARVKAYHRMTEIMREEAPCAFLFGLPSIYGKSKKLAGWTAPSDKVLRMRTAAIA